MSSKNQTKCHVVAFPRSIFTNISIIVEYSLLVSSYNKAAKPEVIYLLLIWLASGLADVWKDAILADERERQLASSRLSVVGPPSFFLARFHSSPTTESLEQAKRQRATHV